MLDFSLLFTYKNEIIWFVLIAANFSLTLFMFRLWGKLGLFVFAALSTVFANIQALKQVDLFGLHTSMGDISYMGVYLISDILSENYGKDVARNIVGIGMFSLMSATLVMYLSLRFIPNHYDFMQPPLETVFAFFPRLMLASMLAFLVSQSYDIAAYQFWRKKFPAYRYIWIRNGLSTVASQLLDNAIFTLVAFGGVFPLHYLIKIFITSCLLRTVISILDTPCVYWSVKMKPYVREI